MPAATRCRRTVSTCRGCGLLVLEAHAAMTWHGNQEHSSMVKYLPHFPSMLLCRTLC